MFDPWLLSEDQTNLLRELYDNVEKFNEAQKEHIRLKRIVLERPTPENRVNCDEHASMFIEKLMAERQDIVQRLVFTAVDQEKLQHLMQDIQPLLKERLMPKAGKLLLSKGGAIIGALAGAFVSQEPAAVGQALKDNVSLSPESLWAFADENLRDILPMVATTMLQAVNVHLLLEIADATGAPSRKLEEMLDKFLNQGVPKGH